MNIFMMSTTKFRFLSCSKSGSKFMSYPKSRSYSKSGSQFMSWSVSGYWSGSRRCSWSRNYALAILGIG